jgi:hypothetical protein
MTPKQFYTVNNGIASLFWSYYEMPYKKYFCRHLGYKGGLTNQAEVT